ncbi:MAG TPA: RICIN domain-containing protein, partial [Spirochaetota bacterium]|nr:RICIN domain-containing protein [Spirochaetota bacterium]
YFKIINKKYGFCIDVKGDSYNDGVNLYLNSDNSNLYQKWIILKNLKSHFKILASSSGKSIEVPYSSFNENEKMILYIPNNTKNQEWILVY